MSAAERVSSAERTRLLIIGAGPFGLAAAASARHAGIEHVVLGIPMDFWHAHMPDGMILRSGCDWHLDPLNVHTIEAFIGTRGLVPSDVEPLSIELYREYASWFRQEKKIDVIPELVQRLDRVPEDDVRFRATLEGGRTIAARDVVLAVGFEYFKNVPEDLAALLPEGRYSHTCDLVDFAPLAGRSCLIIGGRQSAFEWAALIAEAGASAVHVCHRHETPRFDESDWSWVPPLLDETERDPVWLRDLPTEEREGLERRFWQEGRLKLEPWLAGRLDRDSVTLWPNRRVEACSPSAGGRLEVRLDDGHTLTVDQVVLATGYKVNVKRVPFLAAGNVLEEMETSEGHPVLDATLESSVPGLYVTSMMATRDFGSFFAFTVSARSAARMIVDAIVRTS